MDNYPIAPEPSYAERLSAIQRHLATGGKVMVVTYTRGTIYSPKHLDWFSADATGLYVRQGKGKVCLNFTPVKFSK